MKSFKAFIKLIPVLTTLISLSGLSQTGQQIRLIDSLRNRIETLEKANVKTDSSVVLTLLEISTAFSSINKDSLFYYATLAKEKSAKIGFPRGTILSYRNLGFYYSDNGNNSKAIENYCLALSLCDSHNLPNLKPDLLRLIGDEYYFLGDFENSLKNLLEAVEIGSQNKKENFLMLSIANKNIARLFVSQKDYTTALEFYEKVMAINDKMDSPSIKAITYANLAEIYVNMGNVDLSKKFIEKSISYFKTTQRKSWLGFCYRVKAKALFKEGNGPTSLNLLRKAEVIFKELDDNRESIKVFLDIGTLLVENNNLKEAESYIHKAYFLAEELGDKHLLQNSFDLLYKLNKHSDPVKSIGYLEKSKELSDSIFNTNNFRSLNLHKAKLRYDEERKNLISSNNEKVRRKNQLILYVTLVVLILLTTLIPLYFKQKKLNKLNEELNQKTFILKEREEELKKANSSKDMIFSIVGHDLKGPMVALHSLLELYSNGIQKKDLNTYIPKLKSNVESILYTLTNLLNWGQSQLTGLQSKSEVFHLNEVIVDNINFLSEVADLKQISIINNISQQILVKADKNQISLVARNLLNNAIKFTEVGGKAIELKADKDSKYCTVSIIDKGIGIPKKLQNSIFSHNPSRPARGTMNEKGTGLGLMLSKKMIENNNGKIWFSSSSKQGTIFQFTIPMA